MFLPLCFRRGSSSVKPTTADRSYIYVCVCTLHPALLFIDPCFICIKVHKAAVLSFFITSFSLSVLAVSSPFFFLRWGNPLTSQGCVLLYIPALAQRNVLFSNFSNLGLCSVLIIHVLALLLWGVSVQRTALCIWCSDFNILYNLLALFPKLCCAVCVLHYLPSPSTHHNFRWWQTLNQFEDVVVVVLFFKLSCLLCLYSVTKTQNFSRMEPGDSVLWYLSCHWIIVSSDRCLTSSGCVDKCNLQPCGSQ